MREVTGFWVAVLVIVFLTVFAAAGESFCFSCWSTSCMDSAMCGGDDCVCIRTSMTELGYCASIE